jgi:hypothetical protein
MFYLNGGVPDQARALIDFAMKGCPSILILHSAGPLLSEVAKSAAVHARSLGCTVSFIQTAAENIRDVLKNVQPAFVLMLASGTVSAEWMSLIGDISPASTVLIPGLFVDRVLLDRMTPAMAAKSHFAFYPAADQEAVASAVILIEAMKRAGESLSRETLIRELEGMYEFRTGFGPAITYGPNRRFGSSHDQIVIRDGRTLIVPLK